MSPTFTPDLRLTSRAIEAAAPQVWARLLERVEAGNAPDKYVLAGLVAVYAPFAPIPAKAARYVADRLADYEAGRAGNPGRNKLGDWHSWARDEYWRMRDAGVPAAEAKNVIRKVTMRSTRRIEDVVYPRWPKE